MDSRMNSKLSLLVTLVIISQIAQIHSHLYVFGGRDQAGKLLDSASRLSSTSGQWQSLNNMPTARSEFCGAVVNQQIYNFGGFRGEVGKFEMLNSADVYDWQNDTYTLLRDMPKPRAQCGAASWKSSIYVAGGTQTSDYKAVSSVLKYDIQSNKWAEMSPMQTPRSGHQLVELNGLLYAIGGYGQPWLNSVEVYEPTYDRWSYVPKTIYTHTENFGATGHEGKIYVISHVGFEVYDFDTNRWTKLNPLNNYNYYQFQYVSLVSMDDVLWAVGGRYDRGGNWNVTMRVHTYDPCTDRWSKQRDMDVPRMFHTAFAVDH